MTIKIQHPIKITTPPLKIRWASFAVIALLALAVRLPQLGDRPMHTDEAINAWLIGQSLAGEKFHYDPEDRHGPALAEIALPIIRLQGADHFSNLTETQLRLVPVIVGSATVLMFGAAVELFGFLPSLVAALLFAFAPLPVYYSRYFIHETLFVAATLGLILSGGRMLKTNAVLPATLAGFCAALMFACKETAGLHFFPLAVALLVGWLVNRRKVGTPGFGVSSLKNILTAFTVFIVAAVLLFTWLGQNPSALADLFRAVPHLTARAGGQGHEKPCWYYGALLANGWSGIALLTLASIGIFRSVRNPSSNALILLVIYAFGIFAIYSAIPYKTPWLALNLWLPLVLLAGIASEWIWSASPKFSGRGAVLILGMCLMVLIAHDTRQLVFQHPAGEKNPYAYAHTTEDVLDLPGRIEAVARQRHLAQPRIAVVAADAWPLPWYLRKFSNVGYWQPGQEIGDASFFVTTTEVPDALARRLEKFRPEFFGVRPNVLLVLWMPAETLPPP